jgi:hypothetical protein
VLFRRVTEFSAPTPGFEADSIAQRYLELHNQAEEQWAAEIVVGCATRGPFWPAVLAVVLFAATFREALLGHKRTLWVHVLLAMVIVGATATILFWAFSRRRRCV